MSCICIYIKREIYIYLKREILIYSKREICMYGDIYVFICIHACNVCGDVSTMSHATRVHLCGSGLPLKPRALLEKSLLSGLLSNINQVSSVMVYTYTVASP